MLVPGTLEVNLPPLHSGAVQGGSPNGVELPYGAIVVRRVEPGGEHAGTGTCSDVSVRDREGDRQNRVRQTQR